MDELSPKRKPGRPRVAQRKEGASVATWMPVPDYHKIIKTASANNLSVSALVRAWLQKNLRTMK